MVEDQGGGQRLYKARGADGEVAWVDHQELWRLQQAQAEEARRQQSRRRRRLLLLLGLLAAVAVALVVGLLELRSADGPAPVTARTEPAPEAAAPAGGEGATAGPAPEAGGERGPPPAAPEVGSQAGTPTAGSGPRSETFAAGPAAAPSGRAAGAVRAWAGAWASRDVAAYLAAYSSSFRPADGLTRRSWEALRRRRLLTPASIEVEIEGLEVVMRGEGRAEARFVQRYRSPIYADVVRKSLDLVEEEGAWRILGERVEAP